MGELVPCFIGTAKRGLQNHDNTEGLTMVNYPAPRTSSILEETQRDTTYMWRIKFRRTALVPASEMLAPAHRRFLRGTLVESSMERGRHRLIDSAPMDRGVSFNPVRTEGLTMINSLAPRTSSILEETESYTTYMWRVEIKRTALVSYWRCSLLRIVDFCGAT